MPPAGRGENESRQPGGATIPHAGQQFAATWRCHEQSGHPFHPRTHTTRSGDPGVPPQNTYNVFRGPRSSTPEHIQRVPGTPELPAIEAATAATNGPGPPQASLVGWGSGSNCGRSHRLCRRRLNAAYFGSSAGAPELLTNTTDAPEPRRMAGRDLPAPDEAVPRLRGTAESGVDPGRRMAPRRGSTRLLLAPSKKRHAPPCGGAFRISVRSPGGPLRSARGWEITPHRAVGLRRGGDAAQRSGVPQTALRIAATWRCHEQSGHPLPAIEAATAATNGSGSPACGMGGRTAMQSPGETDANCASVSPGAFFPAFLWDAS